jgi:hypothetical protein
MTDEAIDGAIAEACGWQWHGDDSWPREPKARAARDNFMSEREFLRRMKPVYLELEAACRAARCRKMIRKQRGLLRANFIHRRQP